MIKRIELVNFMSHARTVIEPAPGLTVLTGPNNVGKSAVIVALQILCHNENSTYVMRHGASECAVIVETDDGHTVEWRRKKSPCYIIDGERFDRLGRSDVPEELHKCLRLPKVEDGGDDDFLVHFGTQKTPIFLLGSSAANRAKFFASSSDAIKFVEIQRRHKEKLGEATREKNRLEAESQQINGELEALEPVVGLESRLLQVEASHAQLLAAGEEIAVASEMIVELAALQARSKQCSEVVAAIAPLKTPPQLDATEPLEETLRRMQAERGKVALAETCRSVCGRLSAPPLLAPTEPLEQLASNLAAQSAAARMAQARGRALQRLASPPSLDDPSHLEQLTEALAVRSWKVERLRADAKALAALFSPPAQDDTSALSSLVSQLTDARHRVGHAERVHACCSSLPSLPTVVDPGPLAAMVEQCDAATAEVVALHDTVVQAAKDLAAAEAELRQHAQTSVCAACGGPLNPERVLARALAS
jgi:exonuclease SbcC